MRCDRDWDSRFEGTCWMTFTFGCFHSHRRDRRSIDEPVDVLFIEFDQQIWNEFFRLVIGNEEQFARTSGAFQEEFHFLSGQSRARDRDNAFWFQREIIDRCWCFFTDRRLCALQIVGVFVDNWHRRKVTIWTKLLVTNDWRGTSRSFQACCYGLESRYVGVMSGGDDSHPYLKVFRDRRGVF